MNFNFDDLNLVRDVQVDESELAQYYNGQEDDADFLAELEALAEKSEASPVVQGNFGMIRAPLPNMDYNIENVKLTAEDEQNPELLAELSLLLKEEGKPCHEAHAQQDTEIELQEEKAPFDNDGEAIAAEINRETPGAIHDARLPLEVKLAAKDKDLLKKYIQLEKVHAFGCKRAGDQDEMLVALRNIKLLQSRLDELKAPGEASVEDQLASLKAEALEAKRLGNMRKAREIMSKVIQLEKAKGISKPVDEAKLRTKTQAKSKEVLAKLASQIDECYEAAKFYIQAGQKENAGLFLGRKKIFESDLMALKDMLFGAKAIPQHRMVEVELPISLEAEDMRQDELKVLLSGIKPSTRPKRGDVKDFFTSSSSYCFKAVFEWPPEGTEEQHTKTGSLFLPANSASLVECFMFNSIRRDLKGQKFFEHQKLKLELWKRESSFLRTKLVLYGSAQIRLVPLLVHPVLDNKVEILDSNRRFLGISLDMCLKVQRPISGKGFQVKKAQWIVFDELASGRLFQKIQNSIPSIPQALSKDSALLTGDMYEMQMAAKSVDLIASYAVLEFELKHLVNDPSVMDDPLLAARQIALETKRDTLAMKIQLGQLSMEDYVTQVKASLEESKKRALAAKRAGDLQQARSIMSQIQVMENEMTEAEATQEEVNDE